MKKIFLIETLFIGLFILSSCDQTSQDTKRPSTEPPMRTQSVKPGDNGLTTPDNLSGFENDDLGVIMKRNQALIVKKDATLSPFLNNIRLNDGTQIKSSGEILSPTPEKFNEITNRMGNQTVLKDGAMLTKKGDIALMGIRGQILDESPIAGFGKSQRTIIVIMKDGTKKIMEKNTTLLNGMEIKTTGEVSSPNRPSVTLQNGEMMTLTGKVQPMQ